MPRQKYFITDESIQCKHCKQNKSTDAYIWKESTSGKGNLVLSYGNICTDCFVEYNDMRKRRQPASNEELLQLYPQLKKMRPDLQWE